VARLLWGAGGHHHGQRVVDAALAETGIRAEGACLPASVGVLGRSRTESGGHSLRSHPRFGQHATLPAFCGAGPVVVRLAHDPLVGRWPVGRRLVLV
jgi:hypothetical protein